MARTLLPLDPGPLRDDDLRLVLVGRRRGDATKGWVPSYVFEMHVAGHRGAVGHLNLRVGDTEHVLRYAGHIGYGVDPAWRGRHLAQRAVALVLPFAARLGLDPLWITTNPDNAASIRTLERLGAQRVDELDVPAGTEMHARGETRKVRWRIDGGKAAPPSSPTLRSVVRRTRSGRRRARAAAVRERARAFQERLAVLTPHTPVTWTVLAANVALYVVVVLAGGGALDGDTRVLRDLGGNYVPLTTGGQWWRLVTAMFLHAGLAHVAFNMVVFASIGGFLERLLGSLGFAVLYLVSGLLGGVGTLLWNEALLSVGASGAVFGCYGALLAVVLRDRGCIPREMLAALETGAYLFVGVNLALGLLMPGIDMAAHVGGLVGGVLLGLLLSHRLTPRAAATRLWRSAVAAAGSAVVLVALAAKAPRTVDPLPALEACDAAQADARAAYERSARAHQADSVPPHLIGGVETWQAERRARDEALFATLVQEVAPAVRRMAAALPDPTRVPGALRERLYRWHKEVAALEAKVGAVERVMRGEAPGDPVSLCRGLADDLGASWFPLPR